MENYDNEADEGEVQAALLWNGVGSGPFCFNGCLGVAVYTIDSMWSGGDCM